MPLGSSSASMYPGYSPADHEYGKAAEEYGRAAAKARDEGIELKDPEIDYQIGQGRGVKRRSLAEIREAKAARESGSGSGSGSDRATGVSSARPPTTNGNSKEVKSEEADQEGDNPYFVIDTKPTPVNIPGIQNQPPKRSVSPALEVIEGKKHKKAKRKHEGDLPNAKDGNGVQFEDISDKVDARLKEKEEKRKRKEEKKRKRESEGEPPAPAVTAQSNDDADASAEAHKPEKKKTKHGDEEALADRTASKKRSGESAGVLEDGEGKKKKRKKPSTAD